MEKKWTRKREKAENGEGWWECSLVLNTIHWTCPEISIPSIPVPSPTPKLSGCFQHIPSTAASTGSSLSSVTAPHTGTFQSQVIKHHTNSQYLIHHSSLFRDKRLLSECVAGFLWKDQVIKCSSTRISDQNHYCCLFFWRFLSAGR